jgi:hypothetical protein
LYHLKLGGGETLCHQTPPEGQYSKNSFLGLQKGDSPSSVTASS